MATITSTKKHVPNATGASGPAILFSTKVEALKLRAAGATWKEIARTLGVKSPGYLSKIAQSH